MSHVNSFESIKRLFTYSSRLRSRGNQQGPYAYE
jgi:hypothetical protein